MDEDGLGVLRYLPDDEFRMVLRNLRFIDIGNMRCVSKGLKRHVTNLCKSLFNKFHIKGINERNCGNISKRLAKANAEAHAPKKLQLEFEDELTSVMRKMLLDYMDIITSLGIEVLGKNKKLLLQQSTLFKSLESLKLLCSDFDDENVVGVCEAMLAKHAHSLTHFEVYDLNEKLSVPVLPVIDSLLLWKVGDEAAQSLYEKSQNTITSFTIIKTKIKLSNTAAFKIENLKYLCLGHNSSNEFKFALQNSNNLVSLDLANVRDIPGNIEWPEFPSLRELCIDYHERILPIIPKSKDTLEHLIIDHIPFTDSEYAVEMPRLTDLYITRITRVEHEFINNVLSLNCKSLEFLYLNSNVLSYIDSTTVRMNKMKRVMIGSFDTNYSEEDRVKLTVMCPNADIVECVEDNLQEIRDVAKSRCKSKRFLLDPVRFINI